VGNLDHPGSDFNNRDEELVGLGEDRATISYGLQAVESGFCGEESMSGDELIR
jgi:hypothetical protein